MPNDVEKEGEAARRRRVSEEKRRRKNERRLEGQRREYERKCEALRKKATAAVEEEEGDDAQNESNGETRVVDHELGDKEEETQPAESTTTASRSDGQQKRPKKPKRRAAETTSLAPAKNDEHPDLHMIAQVGFTCPPPPLHTLIGNGPLYSRSRRSSHRPRRPSHRLRIRGKTRAAFRMKTSGRAWKPTIYLIPHCDHAPLVSLRCQSRKRAHRLVRPQQTCSSSTLSFYVRRL